jgi:O-antigen/teichoic acid export membrane protein
MANALARAVAHFRTPLFRNSYALMLGSATTSVLGMVYWLIAARLYSLEQVGSNSAAISAIMFISGVSLLSLDGALVHFVPIAGARTTRLVGFTYLVCMGVVGLTSLVICLGLRTWSAQLGNLFDTPAKMAFFIVSAIAWTAFTLEDSVLAGLRQAIWVPAANTLFALAKIGLLVVLATLYPVLGSLPHGW